MSVEVKKIRQEKSVEESSDAIAASHAHKELSLSDTGMSFSEIKELMTHMKKEGVTGFEFGEGRTHVSITREKELVRMPSAAEYVPGSGIELYREPVHAEAAESPDKTSAETGHVVTSPVVGVFYDSPSPEEEPYVTPGSYVKKGDVLCIIEAMKLMNEVTSPIAGQVKEILVKKASRVEYGQKLYVIDPGVPGGDTNE